MTTERQLEILMFNVDDLTDKITFYETQGISTRKTDLLKTRKAAYQQAIIDLE